MGKLISIREKVAMAKASKHQVVIITRDTSRIIDQRISDVFTSKDRKAIVLTKNNIRKMRYGKF